MLRDFWQGLFWGDNITDKAVSKWERGLSLPDISMLKPLSECLGVNWYEKQKSRIKRKGNGARSASNGRL